VRYVMLKDLVDFRLNVNNCKNTHVCRINNKSVCICTSLLYFSQLTPNDFYPVWSGIVFDHVESTCFFSTKPISWLGTEETKPNNISKQHKNKLI